MALLMYFDAACTNQISSDNANPDIVHKSTTAGQTITDELSIWIRSNDAQKTYEDVVLTAQGDDSSADVQYAPDNSGVAGAYVQSLSLTDGTFASALRIWRKITAPNVTQAFNKNIQHKLTYSEYAI